MSREDTERMGTADLVAGSDRQQADAQGRRDPAGQQAEMREQRRDMAGMDGGGMRGDMGDPAQQAQPGMAQQQRAEPMHEELAALFPPQVAQDFRNRWDAVQIGFVDDPRQAVQHADELVAQVMKSLAESFARQRSTIEGDVGGNDASTENLRVALHRYRSFFQRLLSL